MKRLGACILFVLLVTGLGAQDMSSVALSPYAGILGRNINPANISGTIYRFDIQLLGTQFYLDNNYMHFSGESVISAGIRSLQGEPTNYANEWTVSRGGAVGNLLYDYDNPLVKKAHMRAHVYLPSFMLDFGRWTVAFHSHLRNEMSITGVNPKLAKWLYEGLHYDDFMGDVIREENFRLTLGSYLENGLTFSFLLKQDYQRKSYAAITYNRLSSSNNYYVIGSNAEFIYPNDADIDFLNLDLDYGHAINLNRLARIYGGGHSVSLGYVLQEKDNTSRHEFCYDFGGIIPKYIYKWRLGVSLLDLGYMDYDRPGTIRYEYLGVNHYWEGFENFEFQGIEELDREVEAHFDTASVSRQHDNYRIYTPWAASVQYDQLLSENYPIYLSALLVQRIPHFGLPGFDRSNVLVLCPRWETRKFAVALPFTFYEYIHPRLGLSMRLGRFFTIGTHNLSMFIKTKRLDSGSIFVSFRCGMF